MAMTRPKVGQIDFDTDLPIAYGGTGASTAATAFDNLKQAATTSASGVVTLVSDLDYESEFSTKAVTGGALYKKKINIINGIQMNTVFTATFSGTTMTVTGVTSGVITPGQLITGAGLTTGTKITANGTGTGGIGTYTISITHTIPTAITVSTVGVEFNVSATAKRITLVGTNCSTNGTSNLLMRIGKNTVANTGYTSACSNASGATIATATNGFLITASIAAVDNVAFRSTLTRNIPFESAGDSLYFIQDSSARVGNANVHNGCGDLSVYLPESYSSLLVSLTTVGGTSIFDQGVVSCIVE